MPVITEIETATPTSDDTVLGVQGGLVKRFTLAALPFDASETYAAGTVGAKLSQTISVKDEPYGAVGDGVTDDTAAIQAAIDALSEDGELFFPDGEWLFSEVLFDVVKGKIRGSGLLRGTIKVRHPDYLTDPLRHQDFDISGLNFDSSSLNATDRGIILIDTSKGLIHGCKFKNLDSCIYVPVNADTTHGQVANRVKVTGNTYYNCNYFVQGASSAPAIDFGLSDSIITGNEGNALVDHIFVDTYDGITIADNIFFCDGSATKRNCARLIGGTWANIHDNKCFESGAESFYIERVSHLSLHDNLHAWPGQRVEANAVYITGSPTGGDYYTFADIHDEYIYRPSAFGIVLDAKQGRSKVHHNTIHFPGDNDCYYGAGPSAPGTYDNGIVLASDTVYITTDNNLTINGSYTLTDGGAGMTNRHTNNVYELSGQIYRETKLVPLVLSGTETSVDVGGWDIGSLNQSAPTNITGVTSSAGSKLFTFRAYNGNTTFVNGASLVLRGAANVTLGAGQTISFIVYDTSAVETARNF
jgi:hypothetical protein